MPGRSYVDDLREPTMVEVLPWENFTTMFANAYKQGEHIAIVGPTGSGKTMLGLCLCRIIGARKAKDNRPARVTVIQLKPRDDTLRLVLPEKEWPIIKKWPPAYGQEHCIVWPKGGAASGRSKRQRQVLLPLLDQMYIEGGQTVYIPEAAKIERNLPQGLGMGGTMETFWSDARSNKLAVISDTQRPRQVTRLMWSEPSWVFIFKPEDDEDLKRVAELSGRKTDVWRIVPELDTEAAQFMCIQRQRYGGRRGIYVSQVSVTRDKRDGRRER